MFAMLHGRWPRPAPGDAPGDDIAASIVAAQVESGLDLVTDGHARWADPVAALEAAIASGDTGPDGMLVRAWRATDAAVRGGAAGAGLVGAAAGAVAAAQVTGPFSLSRRAGGASALTLAAVLGGELAALEGAGCTLVLVDEPAAVGIGADPDARRSFRDAQDALLAAAPGLHAMLAITGGSAWEAGADTILGAPYRSYLFDLVAGPDNWYLVRATPGDRGIVCAALRAPAREDQAPLLSWAARYAASSNGRGIERVGLANASSLEGLSFAEARVAAAALVRAARLAGLEPEEAIAEGLDPRTFAQPRGRGAKRGGLPRAR